MLASSLFVASLSFGAFSLLRREIEETREAVVDHAFGVLF